MSRYTKIIQQSDTGLVFAQVFNEFEDRVGLKVIEWPFWSQDKRLKRAHEWADRWIENCEKYCTHKPLSGSE